MPLAAGFYFAALARSAAALGCIAAGCAPWRVLRRVLLGDHAADVRRWHRECWLDAGVRCDHGSGKEHALGKAAQPSARCRTGRLGYHHRRSQYNSALRLVYTALTAALFGWAMISA